MSNRSRGTIADVATEAGVSAGTVSRVLNPRLNLQLGSYLTQNEL